MNRVSDVSKLLLGLHVHTVLATHTVNAVARAPCPAVVNAYCTTPALRRCHHHWQWRQPPVPVPLPLPMPVLLPVSDSVSVPVPVPLVPPQCLHCQWQRHLPVPVPVEAVPRRQLLH